MTRPHTVTHQARELAEEAAGYLYADHTIRTVSRRHRAATARLLLTRYTPRPLDLFDQGFRRRCEEFITSIDHELPYTNGEP